MEITLNLVKTTKNYAVYGEEIDETVGQCLPEDATIYLKQSTLKASLEMDEVPSTIIIEVRNG